MTELTPELEALYALHRNVPRGELSMAAQLEYDRLRAAWEQGEARPAAGELEAARLAWEHEYSARHDSGPAIRHAVDRSGTTRTFRYRRVFHMVLGIPVVVIGVGVLVGDAAGLAYPLSSWARGDGGVSTWDSIWMAAVGLVVTWLGIRLFRLGVLQISAGKMRVRGYFRTRAVDASEIRAIPLRRKDIGGESSRLRWRARVELTCGKSFWIDGFDCGRAEKPPKPDRAAILDEVRALLDVRADDIGQLATRLTHDGRAAAPVSSGQQSSESAPDPDVDGAALAGWVKTQGFGTTRLRPGYDIDQVDAFLSAIRNTFLGIREPSLTPEEIRVKQFTTTRLRPGYEQLEVDAVLDEAESRLAAQVGARRRGHAAEPESVAAAPAAEAVQIRCLECGAESADATQVCARCGAPAVGPRSVAAGLAVARPSDGLVAAAAGDAGWPPAWIRRGQPYYMICLIFFLALYMIGWFLFERTQGSGLHHPVEWGIDLGVVGALLSVVLFEAARGQFRARQLVWGLVPLLSWTFLAFVPFLWLALIRRRTREWAVFAVYLAAETTMLVISFVVAAAAGYELVAGLLLIAPVHAVLAFSPAAGASSWRETRAANAASLSPAAGRQPVPVTFGLRPGWCRVNVAALL